MEKTMENNNPYNKNNPLQGLYQDALGGQAYYAQPVADPNNAVIPQYQVPLAQQGQQQVQEEDVDYLASLFDGEELSEDFKKKAAVIFEAAINEKVSILEQHILEAAKEVIQEQTVTQQEALVEHVDGYLNYVISEWMEENKVAIERGLRTEIAENFIYGLKSLFESSFIDVPDEKYNILDDLYESNEDLQNNVNELIKENISLKNEITARLCAEAFIEQSQDLADTQVEKLAKLAEGIEFTNVEQYKEKVALLKESYFGSAASDNTQTTNSFSSNQVSLNEDGSGSFVSSGEANPVMENIVNAITVINKNRPARPMLKSPTDSPINSRIHEIMGNPNLGMSPKDNLF